MSFGPFHRRETEAPRGGSHEMGWSQDPDPRPQGMVTCPSPLWPWPVGVEESPSWPRAAGDLLVSPRCT